MMCLIKKFVANVQVMLVLDETLVLALHQAMEQVCRSDFDGPFLVDGFSPCLSV